MASFCLQVIPRVWLTKTQIRPILSPMTDDAITQVATQVLGSLLYICGIAGHIPIHTYSIDLIFQYTALP